jgi:hypothetical protein
VFEPVAEGEEKVNFMAQLESVETGELVGTMNIPLEPEVELEP